MSNVPPQSNDSRSALQVLPEIRKGHLVAEISEKIKEACAAVVEHGKPAKITIELTIEPMKDGEKLIERPLMFFGEVSAKLPQAKAEATLFFVGQDGNATRNTPTERQEALPLTVAAAAGGTTTTR